MSRFHGRECTRLCVEESIPTPLARDDRPPPWPCPWCDAEAGVACTVRGAKFKSRLRAFGRFHPSRLEVAP